MNATHNITIRDTEAAVRVGTGAKVHLMDKSGGTTYCGAGLNRRTGRVSFASRVKIERVSADSLCVKCFPPYMHREAERRASAAAVAESAPRADAPHTPGPWSVKPLGSRHVAIMAGTHEVASVGGVSWVELNGEANARLIAAAPGMLEALRAILNAPTAGDAADAIAAARSMVAGLA